MFLLPRHKAVLGLIGFNSLVVAGASKTFEKHLLLSTRKICHPPRAPPRSLPVNNDILSLLDFLVLVKGGSGVAFKLLKRGNKGKMEAQEVVVPESTSLAAQVNRNEEASREESSIIKARVGLLLLLLLPVACVFHHVWK